MNHHEATKPSPFRAILQYWQIILLIGASIVAFTTLRVRQAYSEDQLGRLTSRVSQDEQSATIANNAISTQLSQIQTDLSWIKARYK